MTAGTTQPTRWPRISKDLQDFPVVPNLADYDAVCRGFTWDSARRALSGLPGGGLNIAHEAVDRHAAGPRAGHEALRFVRADGSTHSLSYRELAEQTSRFAAVLAQLGIGRTERVFSLMGRSPELYVAVLGTLKNGSVFCPLFSAFGPEPVRQRLQLGTGRVLVTTRALYRKKVARIRGALPDLTHVLLIDAGGEPEPEPLTWPCSWRPHLATPGLPPPRARTWPSSISPAEPPAPRKVPSMCTRPSPPITPRACTLWTCIRTTSTGAPQTRAG